MAASMLARLLGKGLSKTGKKESSEVAKKGTELMGRRNENIDDDTRKRAMASVANLAKGGMVANKGVGASMKPHNVFGKKK